MSPRVPDPPEIAPERTPPRPPGSPGSRSSHLLRAGTRDRSHHPDRTGADDLVSSSIKYAGGHPIRVRLAQVADAATIEVVDKGPGIPEAELSRIFERFERAASARHYGGMGLGLYVARQIAEAHGGATVARNLPEGGARFVVRLPMTPES